MEPDTLTSEEIDRIPVYTQDEILGMNSKWFPMFIRELRLHPGDNERHRILEKLRSLGKITTNFGFFGKLPSELKVEVMKRTSPTAREGSLVSKQMSGIADIALVQNILNDDLVDPSIGMPDRQEYFKINPVRIGEYLDPEPGLWRRLKYYRDNFYHIHTKLRGGPALRSTLQYMKNYQMYLVYGHLKIYPTGPPVKFISVAIVRTAYKSTATRLYLDMVSYLVYYEFIPDIPVVNKFKLYVDLPEEEIRLTTLSNVYDVLNNNKDLVFEMVGNDSYEDDAFGRDLKLAKPSPFSSVHEQIIRIGWTTISGCRVIPLGSQGYKTNTIFPSLLSDVWLI